jgi:NADH dehydrogenase FAD-containing subunit
LSRVKEATMAKQVLILGGGYAGVYAALGGARARGDAAIDITLVSAEPDVQTDGWERRVLMAGTEAKTLKRHINAVWAALPSSSLDRETLLAYGEPGTSKYRDSGT